MNDCKNCKYKKYYMYRVRKKDINKEFDKLSASWKYFKLTLKDLFIPSKK